MKVIVSLIVMMTIFNTYGVKSNLNELLSVKSPQSKEVMREMGIIMGQYKITKDPKDLELIVSKLPTIMKLFKTPYIIEGFYPLTKKNDKDLEKQIKKYFSESDQKDFYKRMKQIANEIENGNG